MDSFRKLTLLAACLVGLGSNGFADIVNVTGGATFTNLNSSILNNNGQPFFDNVSGDGSKCGIGYLLTGANPGACSNRNGNLNGLPTGEDTYSYLSRNGSNAGNFSFTSSGDAGHSLTLYIELAGWHNSASFGYRNLTTGAGPVELFSAVTNNPASTSLSITTGQDFAFYYQVGTARWWTDGAGYGSGPFALFTLNSATNGNSTSAYVLGMEDNRDRDFQDMIVSIRTTATPEPATLGALGAAVLATVFAVRRRRARQA